METVSDEFILEALERRNKAIEQLKTLLEAFGNDDMAASLDAELESLMGKDAQMVFAIQCCVQAGMSSVFMLKNREALCLIVYAALQFGYNVARTNNSKG